MIDGMLALEKMAFTDVQTAKLTGAELAYLESGSGGSVVFVHGGVSDYRTWAGQVGPFSEGYRVIAYSRRYARPNADIPNGVDDQMLPHVEDLIELLQNLNAVPAHLIGHSWGGFIVLLAAIRRPDLIRSITLIEPPVLTLFLDMPPKPGQIISLLLRSPRNALPILKLGATVMAPAEKAFRKGDDRQAIEIFGQGVLGKDRFARLSGERYKQVWDNRRADKAQMLGAGFPNLSPADVRQIQLPALLVTGAESPKAFHRMNEMLATLLRHAQLVVIAGASHIVHEDAPQALNQCIMDFLKSD